MKEKSLWYRISGKPLNFTDLIDYASKRGRKVNITIDFKRQDGFWLEAGIVLHCDRFSATYQRYKVTSDYAENFGCLEEASNLARELSTQQGIVAVTINRRPFEQVAVEAARTKKMIDSL